MDTHARNEAILEHYPLVRSIAARVARRLPSHIDVNDLINVGVIGLIEAHERFDSTRGVPFKGFAEVRIHGAIMDHLRGSDDVPRPVRRRHSRIEAVRQQLRSQLGREPDREEMSNGLGMTPEEYDRYRAQSVARRAVSIDSFSDGENQNTLLDVLPADDKSAEEEWLGREELEALRDEVDRLSWKERKVIVEFYLENRKLQDIGQDLRVTEGRVSQIRKEAVQKLQARILADRRANGQAQAR